ncbi:MAG: metallophosphoesterase [Solirubrobacteraceae bacterium]|nr:metallophosphoesterase [Solirubrobacteraceae bacterium]
MTRPRNPPPGVLPPDGWPGDGSAPQEPRLLAISDLHAAHRGNEEVVAALAPGHPDDWLIVAGDVADGIDEVAGVLAQLRERFARVLWTPGNHELLAGKDAGRAERGVERYDRYVERLRAVGVDTPDDPYPRWEGPGGPAIVAPLFTLYDYGFGATRFGATAAERLERAKAGRVVAVDEYLLDPAPFPSREAWCAARVAATSARLDALDPSLPTVLVSHWPLHEHPTEILRHPEFSLWCGTPRTADWHERYRALAVVYGHLHIPRRTTLGATRFEEVSLGYPREWRRFGGPRRPRVILPAPPPGPFAPDVPEGFKLPPPRD